MTSQSGSGSTPAGTAGGVLGGTYPAPTFATNGTTALLGTLSAVLGSNVPLTTSFADVLTLALGAGTWLVVATVQANAPVAGAWAAKLIDSNAVTYCTNGLTLPALASGQLVLLGVVVLGSAGSVKIQALKVSGTINAQHDDGVQGGTGGTTINALKVG